MQKHLLGLPASLPPAFSSSHGRAVRVLPMNLGWHCHMFGGQNEMSKVCWIHASESGILPPLWALITMCKHPRVASWRVTVTWRRELSPQLKPSELSFQPVSHQVCERPRWAELPAQSTLFSDILVSPAKTRQTIQRTHSTVSNDECFLSHGVVCYAALAN